MNDAAGSRGDVLSDLECRHVGLLRPQPISACPKVVAEILHPAYKVLALGISCLTEHLGIREGEIGRREGVHEHPAEELQLPGGIRVESVYFGDRLTEPAGIEQV